MSKYKFPTFNMTKDQLELLVHDIRKALFPGMPRSCDSATATLARRGVVLDAIEALLNNHSLLPIKDVSVEDFPVGTSVFVDIYNHPISRATVVGKSKITDHVVVECNVSNQCASVHIDCIKKI